MFFESAAASSRPELRRVGDDRKRVALRRLLSVSISECEPLCSQTRKWIRSVSPSLKPNARLHDPTFFVRRSYCRLSENAHQTSADPANRSAATNITTAAIIVSIIICFSKVAQRGQSVGVLVFSGMLVSLKCFQPILKRLGYCFSRISAERAKLAHFGERRAKT